VETGITETLCKTAKTPAKGVTRIRDEHFRGLKALAQEHPEVKQRILVIYEGKSLRREDGIRVLNHRDFIRELWAGKIF
jgi:hypothetical protein